MPTLYQKYRPQRFQDLTGQAPIVQTISNEIKNNKLAQAYLFFGSRGIGKTTLARLLAKSLNCEKRQTGDYEACNECQTCQEITNGRHIDVIEIDAASHTGVDNVRENIIANAQFQPTKAKFKIFIIDEVHMLSISAFNALLKTLEEPPKHVIFILATTELRKLPATIISRCQRFNFKKIPYDDMLKRLQCICEQEKVKVDVAVLARIINKSDGCLRDAESLLGQILSLNLKKITAADTEIILPTSNVETILQFIGYLWQKQTKLAIDLLQQLVTEGINLEQFTYDLLELLRLLMILQIDKSKDIQLDYSQTDIKIIKKMAVEITNKQLIGLIESTLARSQEIKTAPIPQLPLELLIVEFCLKEDPDAPAAALLNDAIPDQSKQTENKPAKKTEQTTAENPKETDANKKIARIKDKLASLTSKKSIKTTLEQIKTAWPRIIEIITKSNHSLSFILKMSDLENLSKTGLLTITVPYSFHQDKLTEDKTKKMIEKTLADILDEKITMDCVVNNGFNSAHSTTDDDKEISELATDFGGEIIS